MSKSSDILRSLFHRIGVVGSARSRAFGGIGVSRRIPGRVFVFLVVIAGAMAFSSVPALAVKEYIPGVSFGEPGSGPGQFSGPVGVAVNDSTSSLTEPAAGDVYVVDKGNDRVERFTAAGVYEGQFNGSGVWEDLEEPVKVKTGTPAPAGTFSAPEQIAVDDDQSSPSFGDVYVADAGHNVIDEFSATGSFISQLGPFSGVVGVVVDHTGDIWVYEGSENVSECSEAGSCVTKFNTHLSPGPGGLAIDSSDNVYVTWENVAVLKFDSATGKEDWFDYFFAEGVEPSAVAINPSTNNLLVGKGGSIGLYGPFGEPYSIVEQGSSGAPRVNLTLVEPLPAVGLSESYGLAVSAAGTAYATERDVDKVQGFTYVSLATEAPSGVTETGLTLHGSVNPEGEPVKECYFEYGTEAGVYSSMVACEQAPGSITGSTAEVPVSAELSGLPPATVRSFRLVVVLGGVAARAHGLTVGTPALSGEAFSEVGSLAAKVSAQIDPDGLASTYYVEYGPSEAYGSTSAETSLGAGNTGTEALASSTQLTGLAPETVYHLRVVARNALGTTAGKDFSFTTFPPPAQGLPDGRAYELVTPPTEGENTEVYTPSGSSYYLTGSAQLVHGIYSPLPFMVASDGEAVVYAGDPPPTGGTGHVGIGGGNEYLARRSPSGGWVQADLENTAGGKEGSFSYFSNDLSDGIFEGDNVQGTGTPPGYENFWTHPTATGAGGEYRPSFTAIPYPAGSGEEHWLFAGANAGTGSVPVFSHLLFESNAGLLEGEGQLEKELGEDVSKEIKEHNNNPFVHYLYDSVDGQPHLVDVLPNGKVAPGATFGSLEASDENGFAGPGLTHVISADGSRVFWTAAPEAHEIQPKTGKPIIVDRSQGVYVRENDTRPQSPLSGEECLVSVDACTIQVAPGGSIFQTANTEGSKVFFTSSNSELYEYDVETGETIELSPGVAVAGVAGTSENGEYVYYVAASSRDIELWHDGVTTLVAASAADGGVVPFEFPGAYNDYATELGDRTAEVTPDGHSLIFMSTESLTGYENKGLDEVFLYETQSGRLTCVSCNPSGEPAVPNAASEVLQQLEKATVGSFFPISIQPTYQPQSIADDGARVFFDSAEPLVPTDTNGFLDVYEWERDGTGSCRTSKGCVYLLSGGKDPENSYLIGTDATGENVFFISRAQLLSQDRGDDEVVYDARVGGVQPPSAPACSGTGCQGVPPAPPIFATPSSVTFNGLGNFPPPPPPTVVKPKPTKCKKGDVKNKKGKCIPNKKKSKKRAKKSSKSKRGGRS